MATQHAEPPPPPRAYPEDIHHWWQTYKAHADNKSGHDALLSLAEGGLRRLTSLAYSLRRDEPEPLGRQFDKFVGRPLVFGEWLRLLQLLLPPLMPHWDLSRHDGELKACGLLLAARGQLREVERLRPLDPLERVVRGYVRQSTAAPEQVDGSLHDDPLISLPRVDWTSAWRAIIDYRNDTVGHPSDRVVLTEGFYALMVPVLAAAVAELLWNLPNSAVKEIFIRHPVARFDGPLHQDAYHTLVRDEFGYDTRYTMEGPEARTLSLGTPLVIALDHYKPPRFLAVFQSPEKDKPVSPRRNSVVPTQAVDDQATSSAGPVGNAGGVALGQVGWAREAVARGMRDAMAYIAPGTYGVGEANTEVEITRGFQIARTLVRQSEYEAIRGTNPSRIAGPDLPVDTVSWLDAVRFCNELSEAADLIPVYENIDVDPRGNMSASGFRLLTECEWEIACRQAYPDESAADLKVLAWYQGNADRSQPVGKRPVGEYARGLFDLLGNVREWCYDTYHALFPAATVDPLASPNGSFRVLRGGSWNDTARCVTPTYRFYEQDQATEPINGFRVGRTLTRDES